MKNTFFTQLNARKSNWYFDAITASGILLFTAGIFTSGWFLLTALG